MKMPGAILGTLTVLAFSVLGQISFAAGLTPVDLRCEYAVNPLGVDVKSPRLFWKVVGTGRGERQTAYRILVASTADALKKNTGDLWDSGKVDSDATIQIPYSGRPLNSSQEVFWKVSVWDQNGVSSGWSPPATWTMGVLDTADWHAHWIASSTNTETLLLRRDFTVKRGLKRALVHVCGLGQYELSINGAKAGDDVLSPGWTKYDKTCLYDTRDITSLVHRGANAIGLFLGNGMYNVHKGRYTKFTGTFGPLKAIAQLRLEYVDGSTEVIGTDGRWRVHSGPITFSSVYGGEDYDARLEPRGWNRAGFKSADWSPAAVVDGPGGELRGLSCAAPPIRTFEVFKPVNVRSFTNGVTVYDLGQNAAIMPRLNVRGPAGSVVRIIPAELLKHNGYVDRGSEGGGSAYWQYTLAGNGGETWFPKFFYQGCRYLQVECFPAPGRDVLPKVNSIEGVVVQAACPPVGEFECSNDLFNRIRRLVRWAQRSNMMSVMTDCPHREKLGWLEQDHLNGPALRYEFSMARLFTKVMNDIQDCQLPNGFVPNTAPEYVVFGKSRADFSNAFRNSPEWGSAFLLVPWQQYQFDGDLELLRRHYEGMRHYVAFLASQASNHIVSFGLGDWYDLGPKLPGYAQLTPVALTATAFYYEDTRILARVAALLGKEEDARRYEAQATEIRTAFNRAFLDRARKQYATGSQCANAIPLVMGLAPQTDRSAALEAIVKDVRDRGNALTAGDVGYRYLLRALAEGGRSDVIFDMNNQSDKPGYGYQLKMGATSLTEAWNARRGVSQNHFMLGQITEWFYHDLAGIASAPEGPGFKKIIINPQPVGDVRWVNAGYDSIHGRIVCDWSQDKGNFTLKLSVPANTTATVFLPAKSADEVTEGKLKPERSVGVKFLRFADGRAIYHVESGRYEFHSKM